jgi:hypothetical protein
LALARPVHSSKAHQRKIARGKCAMASFNNPLQLSAMLNLRR